MLNFSKTQVLIFIIIILLLANIAMVVSFAMKQPERKSTDRQRRPSPIASVLKDKVGFSQQQMEQIDQLKKTHRERMHFLFEDIRKEKIAFYHHVNLPIVADSTIERLSSRIALKQQAIEQQAFKNFREIRALCTPEQLPRYDSLMPKVIINMWFPEKHGSGRHKESGKDHKSS